MSSPAILDTCRARKKPLAEPAPVAVVATCKPVTRTPLPLTACAPHCAALITPRGTLTDSVQPAGDAPPNAVRLGTVPVVCEPNSPIYVTPGTSALTGNVPSSADS